VAVAILDTGVYVDHWEHGAHEEALEKVRRAYIVRHSAIVLSELRRGARSRESQGLVAKLFTLARVRWEPSASDWWEAGKLVREIGDRQGWETQKRREFQNDALIGLTARRFGATIVTTNILDFSLLRAALRISVLPVSPNRER
jgi:predicted nucleic acid-binding protein